MDLQTGDGRSLAGQKVFGELQRSRLCKRACLDSTIWVSDTITEWKSDPRKSQITIRQLLSQTDGIEGASHLQRPSIRDRNAMAIGLPSVAEPVFGFYYGPSHLQIFSELLRRKLKGRSVITYFEAHVSSRLGLRDLEFKKDARGNPLPATGFELTAREWARLGRACNWQRQLPSTPNCPLWPITRGVCWFAGKSGVRTHVLVEPTGTERTRGRYGTNARFAVAKCAMVRPLLLQGCACGHGGGAWVALPAAIHYSVVESSHCPRRIGRKLLQTRSSCD